MGIPQWKFSLQEQVAQHAWLKNFGEHFHYDKDGGVSNVLDKKTGERGNRQSAYYLEINGQTKAFTVIPVANVPQAYHKDKILTAFLEEGISAARVTDPTAAPLLNTAHNIGAYIVNQKAGTDDDEKLLEGWVICDYKGEITTPPPTQQSTPQQQQDNEFQLSPVGATQEEWVRTLAQDDARRAKALAEEDEFTEITTEKPNDPTTVFETIKAQPQRLKTNLEVFLETEEGKAAKKIVEKQFELKTAEFEIEAKKFDPVTKLLKPQSDWHAYQLVPKKGWRSITCICPFTGEPLCKSNSLQLRLHKPSQTDPAQEEEHWITVSRRGLRLFLFSTQENYESLPAGFKATDITEDDIRITTQDNYQQAQYCTHRFNHPKFAFSQAQFELFEDKT
ncbi:hypothetical protein [Parashewanella tropica]|uniref:hypothetical protein n=1 Tax=Parashewanella tropica TaxID=2547970 RepID=UPI00105A2D55|nr:hypothetical protein [Parashewanella tropica]